MKLFQLVLVELYVGKDDLIWTNRSVYIPGSVFLSIDLSIILFLLMCCVNATTDADS